MKIKLIDKYIIKFIMILKMVQYKISLDCPPGYVRPDKLLPITLQGTELKPEDFEITSRVFGSWTFELNLVKNDLYSSCWKNIKEEIENLYYAGRIRYGEWSTPSQIENK